MNTLVRRLVDNVVDMVERRIRRRLSAPWAGGLRETKLCVYSFT